PVAADDARLGLPADLVRSFAGDFVASYQDLDDPVQWFQQIRDLADKFGFAGNAKEYKKNPDAYPGSIRSRARSSLDANGPTAKFNRGDSTPACGRVGAMASAACTAAVSRLD